METHRRSKKTENVIKRQKHVMWRVPGNVMGPVECYVFGREMLWNGFRYMWKICYVFGGRAKML